MSIQAGDVVVLKSGGIRMTVETVEDGNATCVWQEKSHTNREVFAEILLKKYEPSAGVRVVRF